MNTIRLIAVFCLAATLPAQVTSDRILKAADAEPQNWLTYNGSYDSQHFRQLKDINRENVANLELKWVWQARSLEKFEMTPLIVDDVMYIVQMPNDVIALDAKTGSVYWSYTHVPGRILAHSRAPGRQRQADLRQRGRRVWHPRLHRRGRPQERRRALALQHDSASG